MADEYISRKAAYKTLTEYYHHTTQTMHDALREALDRVPSADVQPVRHGRWGHRWVCSNMTGYEYACSCSECGKPTYRISTLEDMPPCCPNCGCRMDLEADNG